MILERQERICCGASERIEHPIATIDPLANVAINPVGGSVTVDGLLSKEQAIAGWPRRASTPRPRMWAAAATVAGAAADRCRATGPRQD